MKVVQLSWEDGFRSSCPVSVSLSWSQMSLPGLSLPQSLIVEPIKVFEA